MKVLRRETFKSAATMGSIKGRFTWLMWTTRGHLIIKAGEAAKQQLRCRPAGASSSLIIISPFSEVLRLHSNWNSNECAQVQFPFALKTIEERSADGDLSVPCKVHLLGGPTDCLGSVGSSKALQRLRWKRDRSIVWPSLENQRTIQFCKQPPFAFVCLCLFSFLLTPAEICALYFPFLTASS